MGADRILKYEFKSHVEPCSQPSKARSHAGDTAECAFHMLYGEATAWGDQGRLARLTAWPGTFPNSSARGQRAPQNRLRLSGTFHSSHASH